jgi:hypothetical protein
MKHLLLTLDSLIGHVEQSVLGLAFGEVGDGSLGFLGVFHGESASLLNAITLED